jgi:hypothetical protein
MKRPGSRRIALLLALLLAAGAGANTLPPEVRTNLPNATLGANSRFTFFGFDVYDANLWVAPGFSLGDYDRHAFALTLTYLRDFSGESIAGRSVSEMRRQTGVTDAQLATWNSLMSSTFPNVRKGDRLTGIHRPGGGATFLLNGLPAGSIEDAEFSRRFFGIWLSAQTSDTRLREALTTRVVAR